MTLKDFIIEKSEKAVKEMDELSKIKDVTVEVVSKIAKTNGRLAVLNEIMQFMMENDINC